MEALARYGQECEPKVRERLAVKLDDYSNHPMKWLEPLVVRLAGQAHLESAIPQIVAKLLDDGGDVLNSECAEAMIRIGTPAVLHAVGEAFPTAGKAFRNFATSPLEHIHSDLAVEIGLELVARETDEYVRRNLAYSLLSQFAQESIEIARNLLVGRELDFDDMDLRNHLVETCTLTGERFPEYDKWLATEKAEDAEHWKRMKELEDDPRGQILYALEKLASKKAADVAKETQALPPAPRIVLPKRPALKQKVGRNDRCPCGSGKKFKLCCMRK